MDDIEHLLANLIAPLSSKATMVHSMIGEVVAVKRDMGEDDIGGDGGTNAKKNRSGLHVSYEGW